MSVFHRFGQIHEQQQNVDDTCDSDDAIDDSRPDINLIRRDEFDQIEIKQTDQSPVDGADDRQNETGFLQ